MRFSTDAIVIRQVPFSESSQIVHVLTAQEGQISCLAKGVYRPKSSFGGALDLLTRGVADVKRSRSSDLDLLIGYRMTQPYRGVRSALSSWLSACYVLEVVRRFSWPRDLETDLFRLLSETLDGLDAASDSSVLDVWLSSFAARVIGISGFSPRLDACVSCGTICPEGAPASFSIEHGGVLCRNCVSSDPKARRCAGPAVELLRRLFGDQPTVRNGVPERVVLAEVRQLLDRYMEYRLERPLRTRRLFEEVRLPPC